jgi:hypothetical protein
MLAQTTIAQDPKISTRYSNEEISQMIKKHKMTAAHDVVPTAELQQKFKADFPRAYDVEWESAEDIYEVEFNIKLRDYTAYYDANGNLLMTIQEIRRSELPAIVQNAAVEKYPKYKFEDIDKIRRGTEVFYKIEMELRDTDVKLLIKSDGVLLDERFDY